MKSGKEERGRYVSLDTTAAAIHGGFLGEREHEGAEEGGG